MILTKYDEIMEKITLSSEAKDRIIENVAEEVSKGNAAPAHEKSTLRSRSWKRYIAIAACCLLVFAGVRTAMDSGMFRMGSAGSSSDMGPEQNLAVQPEDAAEETEGSAPAESDSKAAAEDNGVEAVLDAQPFESEEELSDNLGFSIVCPDLHDISEEDGLSDVSYIAYGNRMGEVVYSGEETKNYFRKAEGTEDISGDYNEYEYMAEFDGERVSGTLKGDSADSYELAVWTSIDGYTYAAYVERGLSTEEWSELIDSCTE